MNVEQKDVESKRALASAQRFHVLRSSLLKYVSRALTQYVMRNRALDEFQEFFKGRELH